MNKNNKFLQGIIFAFINSLCLGFLGVVDKVGRLNTSDPFLFSTQSIIFSLLFATIFALLFFKQDFLTNFKRLSLRSWIYIFFVGIFASGLFALLRFLGLTQSTGTFASLSVVITSVVTALLAAIFLKERLSRSFWFLFALILVAVYLVSVGQFALTPLQKGDTFIIMSALSVACGNIFSQIAITRMSAINLAVGRLTVAALFLIATNIFLFNNSAYLFHFDVWAGISGFIWAVTIIVFNLAIQRIGVTLTLTILMTGPIYTMILESFILKQMFNPLQVIAAIVVIVCGIFLVALKNK